MPVEGWLSTVPTDVLARVGPSPRELTRLGSSGVLEGNGLVLKAGPVDRAAREAFVLDELAGSSSLRVPALVDAGPGWLLLQAVELAEPGVELREGALTDLAALHDTYAEAPLLGDERLRDVAGRELPELLERARRLRPPEPFRWLADDPTRLLAELTHEATLVHGDAWHGNVLGTTEGGRCWIDWEEAGVGHPALDLANWLHGSPWVPPARDPDGDLTVYLAAREGRIDEADFRRSVDAAVVLLFILLDLASATDGDEESRRLNDSRAAVARRFTT